MYSNHLPPPQQQQHQSPEQMSRSVAPETFLLDQNAQQSLPPDSVVALTNVDNRKCICDVVVQQDQPISIC
jgi:transcription factor STE12